MSALLSLEQVSKRIGIGARSRLVLDDVSFSLGAGEVAVVWGMRRSGRSTLLHVASGLEPADSGIVCFDGRRVDASGWIARHGLCFCRQTFDPRHGRTVFEQLVIPQRWHGVRSAQARDAAFAALRRAGVEHCAAMAPGELEPVETVRVVIARALTRSPRVLVIDEPLLGVDFSDRGAVLALLHSLADDGVAVLASTSDPAGLAGVDHALSLVDGHLQWDPVGQRANVVELRRTSQR